MGMSVRSTTVHGVPTAGHPTAAFIVKRVDADALVITDMVRGINKSPHRLRGAGVSPTPTEGAPAPGKDTAAPLPPQDGDCEHEQSA